MRTTMRRMRQMLFGLAVAGSLGFGATQALASQPALREPCDGEGQIYVGTCPGKNCGSLCPSGVGACSFGCCNCRY